MIVLGLPAECGAQFARQSQSIQYILSPANRHFAPHYVAIGYQLYYYEQPNKATLLLSCVFGVVASGLQDFRCSVDFSNH